MKTCGDEFKSYRESESYDKMLVHLGKLQSLLKKLSKKPDFARIVLAKLATVFSKVGSEN